MGDLRTMRIPLFLIASALACSSVAQDSHHGPRFGLGLATQSVGGLFQNTSNLMPAPLLGWHFDLPIHQQVSVMPEVLWMTKGFSFRNPAMATRAKSTFNYLEVPVLLKVHMERNRSDGLFLLGGPSMGYFINGTYKQWVDGDLLIDGKYTLPPNGRRMQISGLVGMGIEGEKWGFDVRAQTSVTPFERFTRIQNVVYALTFAYRIGEKKPKPRVEDEE